MSFRRLAADHAGCARDQGDAAVQVRRHVIIGLVVSVHALKNLLVCFGLHVFTAFLNPDTR